MRTERLGSALLIAALLTCGGLATAAAAQDTAPPEPPAPPATEIPRSGVVITGNHTVPAGETVEGLVVVGGDLQVEGEVTGDAVVVGGDLVLQPGGLVAGNAVVTNGEIVQNGGRVRGEMRMVSGGEGATRAGRIAPGETAPSREVIVETRHDRSRSERGIFRGIQRGIAGIMSTLAFGLVLAGAGALLIFYGSKYLETVSDTIRTSTVRSGGVGLAALFLVVPAFVVLVVALAVSIIGIPFLLVAVPLYPLAIAAAGGFGLLAAAHALGERTAEQRRAPYERRNSYAYLFTGLGMLLAPLIAADLIAMTGILGIIGGILKVFTWVAIWIAMTIGFGAVILSRLGTQRGFIRGQGTEGDLDSDPLFDDEPIGGGHDV